MDDLDEQGVQEAELPNVSANAGSQPCTPRKENTARRHKRFSLPAQTSPVTTRPSSDGGSKAHSHRFSLVLGKGGGVSHQSEPGAGERSPTRTPFRHSMAAGRLTEFLGRTKD